MLQVAVRSAVLYVSNLIVNKGIPLAEAAADFINVMHAKCIAQPVRVVVKRHLCPFNHVMVKLCIAVIVINRSVLVTQTINDPVGHFHDKDCGESR
jgi:hypothetical protein